MFGAGLFSGPVLEGARRPRWARLVVLGAVLGALPACANQCGADTSKSDQPAATATPENAPSSPPGEGGVSPFAVPKGISPNRRGTSTPP